MADIDIVQVRRILSGDALEAANIDAVAFTVESLALELFEAAAKLDPTDGLTITMRAQTGVKAELTPRLIHVMSESYDGYIVLTRCEHDDRPCAQCERKVPRAILEMRE